MDSSAGVDALARLFGVAGHVQQDERFAGLRRACSPRAVGEPCVSGMSLRSEVEVLSWRQQQRLLTITRQEALSHEPPRA